MANGRRKLLLAAACLATLLALGTAAGATTLVAGGNYSGQNLAGEVHRNEDLHDIILTGANLSNIDFRRSNLTDALLDSALLAGADLRRADLTGASATNTNWANADLRNGVFTGINLNLANLVNADLRNADLGGASLLGANLSGVRTNGANFVGAFYSASTVLPSGFNTTGMIFVPEGATAGLLLAGLGALSARKRPKGARSEAKPSEVTSWGAREPNEGHRQGGRLESRPPRSEAESAEPNEGHQRG